nr:hypothetical protein CFP56_66953 [Quercus suber]
MLSTNFVGERKKLGVGSDGEREKLGVGSDGERDGMRELKPCEKRASVEDRLGVDDYGPAIVVKRHSSGSAIVVMRHSGDVGLIWWVLWADLIGFGGDCGPAVRGFDLVGEWVGASGSWMFVLEVPRRWVSNFKALDSKLVAEWVAGLTLYKYIPTSPPNNRPVKSEIPLFKRVEAFIAYKEHILAFNSTNVEPKWGWLGLRSLTVKFSTRDLEEDQMEVEDWVLEDIRKDRDNGAVTFGMEIGVWTQGYQRSFWAQCPKLRVDFNQPEGEATWPNDCHVSKWYHPLNTLYR